MEDHFVWHDTAALVPVGYYPRMEFDGDDVWWITATERVNLTRSVETPKPTLLDRIKWWFGL